VSENNVVFCFYCVDSFIRLLNFAPFVETERPTTRRASGTLLVNFGVATLIGVISGQYIFKDSKCLF